MTQISGPMSSEYIEYIIYIIYTHDLYSELNELQPSITTPHVFRTCKRTHPIPRAHPGGFNARYFYSEAHVFSDDDQ